jgi:hypothetical protein
VVTRAIFQAGKLLDVDVLDHMVIGQGEGRWVSMKERGLGCKFEFDRVFYTDQNGVQFYRIGERDSIIWMWDTGIPLQGSAGNLLVIYCKIIDQNLCFLCIQLCTFTDHAVYCGCPLCDRLVR